MQFDRNMVTETKKMMIRKAGLLLKYLSKSTKKTKSINWVLKVQSVFKLPFLPPASVLEVVELVLFVCVSACVTGS